VVCGTAQVLLAVYPFLWWQLYSLLLRQRRKRLGVRVARPLVSHKLD
jgi:hypothetical protein